MRIINLLPKPKQEELRYEILFRGVASAAVMGLATLLFVVVLQVGLGVYLSRQQNTVADQIEQVKKQSNKEENASLKTLISGINTQLKDYQDLSNAAPLWSEALRAFAADVPEGVKIGSFNADTAKKQIDIGGYAPSRDLVIELYNTINEDTTHFRDINYPLENVSRPTDVDFHFTFFVQEKVTNPNGGGTLAPASGAPAANPAAGEGSEQ